MPRVITEASLDPRSMTQLHPNPMTGILTMTQYKKMHMRPRDRYERRLVRITGLASAVVYLRCTHRHSPASLPDGE